MTPAQDQAERYCEHGYFRNACVRCDLASALDSLAEAKHKLAEADREWFAKLQAADEAWAAAERRSEELRRALEPFAHACDEIERDYPGQRNEVYQFPRLEMRAFRAARTALQPVNSEGEKP